MQNSQYWIGPLCINPRLIPTEEHGAAFALVSSLHTVGQYVVRFHADLELFEQSRQRSREDWRAREWIFLAARDGAMTLFHFGEFIDEGIRLDGCPTLAQRIDPKPMREARSKFSKTFPHTRIIRHSIAHDGENKTPKRYFDENNFVNETNITKIKIDPNAKIAISDSLFDNRYVITYDKSTFSYVLDENSLTLLHSIAKIYMSSFDNIAVKR